MNFELFFSQNSFVLFLIVAWSLPWKGISLWRAAKNDHKWWFIVLLVINTLGILEISYIFFFSRKKEKAKADNL